MTDMRTAFAAAAEELLDSDPLSAVVLAEISADLFAKAAARHPQRVLNVGIREQLMMSAGGGLALAGLRPIVHTYAPFLVSRAFEQVKLDLGHQGTHAVLVSVGASYDAARGGRTHQAPEDVALLDTLPGFVTHVPGHPGEVPGLLSRAMAGLAGPDGHSSYIRLSVTANEKAFPVSPGLQVVKHGTRAVVVAVGPMLDPVLAAVEDLDVTVAYATTVRPLDGTGLRELASKAAGTVIVAEPYLAGTSTRQVAEALASEPHRVLGLGVPRTELRRYGTPEDHSRLYGLDAPGIRRSVTGFLGA
jgi:transketolase